MSLSAVTFYILSAFILITGLLAVTTRRIFRSAIWLLFSLAGIAGLYFWLHMEFIAAVQIIIYVGGIVVLILFSIFLTEQAGKELVAPARRRAVFSALAALFGLVLTFTLIRKHPFTPTLNPPVDAGVSNIGEQMLSPSRHGYLLPFEVVSVLLLAAMIGCIVVALKTKPEANE